MNIENPRRILVKNKNTNQYRKKEEKSYEG